MIFAYADDSTIRAVIDYHGAAKEGSDGPPRFASHTCTLKLERSTEWNAWKGQADKPIEQHAFADFVEERSPDFVDPDAATMLEIATNFQVNRKMQFTSAVRLESGDVQFQYTTDTASKSLEIPNSFKIRVPVFKHGDPVEVSARFRYRISEGDLRLRYKLDRADVVYDNAWLDVVEAIRARTSLVVFL